MSKFEKMSEIAICRKENNQGISEGIVLTNENKQQLNLFLVNLVRKFPGENKMPITGTFHVLAPDLNGAISQAKSHLFPDLEGAVSESEMENVTATGFQVPMLIRGWGRQLF